MPTKPHFSVKYIFDVSLIEAQLGATLSLLSCLLHPFWYLWLFGVGLLCLLQIHVQAFVRAAVHLRDGWRGGGAHVAVVPAPVAAAAAVRQLTAAALHVR